METEKVFMPGNAVGGGTWHRATSLADFGNGSGFSRTAFTTLKMAVFAPMPSVRIAKAEIANPGFFRNIRNARATCEKTSDMLNQNRCKARPGMPHAANQAFRSTLARLVVRIWDSCGQKACTRR